MRKSSGESHEDRSYSRVPNSDFNLALATSAMTSVQSSIDTCPFPIGQHHWRWRTGCMCNCRSPMEVKKCAGLHPGDDIPVTPHPRSNGKADAVIRSTSSWIIKKIPPNKNKKQNKQRKEKTNYKPTSDTETWSFIHKTLLLQTNRLNNKFKVCSKHRSKVVLYIQLMIV